MIKAFISKVGEGKSTCAIAECVAQKNKRVAYISTEMSIHNVLKRAAAFNLKCEKFTVFFLPQSSTILSLCKKVESLSEEFDIICIDPPISTSSSDLRKINDACFKNFMNQCTELWITMQTQRLFSPADISSSVIKKSEIKNLLIIKQVCSKTESLLLPGVSLIKAVDLETKEIKTYNMSNLLKNRIL